jgi:hypothetical protein
VVSDIVPQISARETDYRPHLQANAKRQLVLMLSFVCVLPAAFLGMNGWLCDNWVNPAALL